MKNRDLQRKINDTKHSKTDKYWRDTMMDELLSEAAIGKCVDNCLRKHKVACGPRFHPPLKGPCPMHKNGGGARYLVSLFGQLLVGPLRLHYEVKPAVVLVSDK